MLELVARRVAGNRGGRAERGDAPARLADHRGGRQGAGSRGRRASRRSRGVLARHHRHALDASAYRGDARAKSRRFPTGPTIIATGPLTSATLGEQLNQLIGPRNLYFYDAIAPIIARDSIDMDKAFLASRYEQGRRRLHQLPDDRGRVRGLHRGGYRGGKDGAASVREAGLFRRMHADRGDGAPRPADALVRPDEAGRNHRSSHRAASVCGGAASPG